MAKLQGKMYSTLFLGEMGLQNYTGYLFYYVVLFLYALLCLVHSYVGFTHTHTHTHTYIYIYIHANDWCKRETGITERLVLL
jgi:hypothetical protein